MTSPRTVALFTSVAGWRGSATSYLKIARGMAASGWRVHAIVGGDALLQPFLDAGATAESVLYPSTGLGAARDLARRLRQRGVSALIADTPRDMRLAVLARVVSRVPVVYRYNLNYRAPHTGLGERLYLRATAGCVFQGRAIAAEFMRVYPGLADHPRWIIPNGYEHGGDIGPSRAREIRERFGVSGDRTVVLCGAMLVASKGHDTLFAAMRLVADAGVDATLIVCGDGGAAADIKAAAATARLPVIFTGLLSQEEMRAAYAMADVVVHPSEREIFPNVVAEAMACGTAVVAVDSWGTPDVVGEAGVLVPPREPAAMAAMIVALARDDGLRREYAARARSRIRERFPMARMVDGYRRVLDAVARVGGG